jgi:hypothetical protein
MRISQPFACSGHLTGLEIKSFKSGFLLKFRDDVVMLLATPGRLEFGVVGAFEKTQRQLKV